MSYFTLKYSVFHIKEQHTKCTLFSYCRLGEYLGMYLNNYPDVAEIPEDVCVKHVIYAWQLALDVRETDQGRRRSMMS